jgi:aminopeptidase N
VELDVTGAKVDGKAADFEHDGAHVVVHLPRLVKKGSKLEVALAYKATPRRGLYFIAPDADFPKRPVQAWTQGQDEDSRFWFPCLDTPAQKCSSEVTATFPKKMTALSNGVQLSDVVKGDRRTMRFHLDAPHSPYLVTLVVGEFEAHEAKAGLGTVKTLFPKGRKDDALRCVARTPEMVKLFEKVTGRAYPWGDYAQVFVNEFIFGGMENTGATTLTDLVLHDERAHLDYSAEFLIAHELAHQWFGDLLTCRDWPHGWLNEGFATYAEILWKEEGESRDEADHQRKVDLESYLSEVSDRYARPIVARKFDAPIDLFDRHLYEKGALVLHELRTRLDDDDFFLVVKEYVKAHAGGAVETVDLARSVERVTGKNLDRFFDEYVHRAGHPALKVDASWSPEAKAVRVAVSQTQAGDTFHLKLPVSVEAQGAWTEHQVELKEKEHVFFLPCPKSPSQVAIDARRDLLATFDVTKPIAWWRREVTHGPCARAKTEAAPQLAKDGAAASLEALAKVLASEREFWGTRAAAAKALGQARAPAAKAALMASLQVKHPKARRAVTAALGEFRGDAAVAKALAQVCSKGDASGFVEGEAARALGKTRTPGALETLLPLLSRPAFQDAVQCGAIDGLAALQVPAAWKPLVEATRPSMPPVARRSAVGAVARVAELIDKKAEAVDVIGHLLLDSQYRMRLAAIDAAATLGDERLIGPLESAPFLDGREKRAAREAVRKLRAHAPAKELASLRESLEKLTAEVKALKEKVDAKPAKPAHR